MILNTGNRTDIPAYFSKWFYNRIREQYVLVRNPFFPDKITKYVLNPKVIDVICFCSKNPEPMIRDLDLISEFNQFWFITITGYGKDIEPNVPHFLDVIESFKKLSNIVGAAKVSLRYDPIFISDKYTVDYHLSCFRYIIKELGSYTNQCVISFVDLYEKTKVNFRGVTVVSVADQDFLAEEFAKICTEQDIKLYTCLENPNLSKFGIDTSGCMTKAVLENALGFEVNTSKFKPSREGCNCLLGNDIGEYNTCNHACKYCYANINRKTVLDNLSKHNPNSPLLIGEVPVDAIITESKQQVSAKRQIKLF